MRKGKNPPFDDAGVCDDSSSYHPHLASRAGKRPAAVVPGRADAFFFSTIRYLHIRYRGGARKGNAAVVEHTK
jgi:hypothetical protein